MTDETFYPTIAFGFSKVAGKDVLHQMWISNLGDIDWRPVPMIELAKGATYRPSIAGTIPLDGDSFVPDDGRFDDP